MVSGDPGDDWRYTYRVQYARIVGPLYLDSSQDAIAARLTSRYRVDVNVGSGSRWLDSVHGVEPDGEW